MSRYKVETRVSDNDKWYEVIDLKQTITDKAVRYFDNEQSAQYFIEKVLKSNEDRARIVEVSDE